MKRHTANASKRCAWTREATRKRMRRPTVIVVTLPITDLSETKAQGQLIRTSAGGFMEVRSFTIQAEEVARWLEGQAAGLPPASGDTYTVTDVPGLIST